MTFIDIRKVIAISIPPNIRKYVSPKIAQHLYFKGVIPVMHRGKRLLELQANGYFLENEIFFYGLEGGHESRSMKIWIEYCEKFKPKHVYDIGASTGVYGLVAKALDTNAQVSFFEPIAKAVEILQMNLDINKFTADVFNIAISNYDGVGYFYMENTSDFAYSVTLNSFTDLAIMGSHNEDFTLRKIETPVAQISTLIEKGLIKKPNLVKIDVETHEHEVLEGFNFDLWEVDAFLVEVLNQKVATKLNDIFRGFDFRFFNINDSLNTVIETEFIEVSEQYNYFIVKPSIVDEMYSLLQYANESQGR